MRVTLSNMEWGEALMRADNGDGRRAPHTSPLERTNYWSSTEYSSSNAWNVNFSNGNVNTNSKTSNSNRVRPVSALSEQDYNRRRPAPCPFWHNAHITHTH